MPTAAPISFDLFRLSKGKATVDVSVTALRDYHRRGLPFYRQGKAVFISKTELERFIRDPNSFAHLSHETKK